MAAVASLLLIVVSGAVAAAAFQTAGHKESVIAVARPVQQGAAITVSDLRVVRISSSAGVAVIPASMAARVIGMHASVALTPGSLVTLSDFSTHSTVESGEAIVGLALKEGQLPAEGVEGGEWVALILTDPAGQPLDTASQEESGSGGSEGLAGLEGIGDLGDTASEGAGSSRSTSPLSPPLAGTVLVPDALVESGIPESTPDGTYQEQVCVEVPSALAGVIAAASSAGQVSIAAVSLPPGAGS